MSHPNFSSVDLMKLRDPTPSLSATSATSPTTVPLPTPGLSLDLDPSLSNWPTPESAETIIRDDQSRFLGPTSYAANFLQETSEAGPHVDAFHGDDSDNNSAEIPTSRLREAADVLTLLSNTPAYRKLFQCWFDLGEGSLIPEPLVFIWLDEIWSDLGHILRGARDDQLYSLAERMWRNSKQRIVVTCHTTPEEWARSASGKNLRWDVVGVIFSLVGIIAINQGIVDLDGQYQRPSPGERAVVAKRMYKCAELCRSFCSELTSVDDVYLCLLQENRNLSESLHGDARRFEIKHSFSYDASAYQVRSDHSAWQKTGELCDAIILAGLHRGNSVDQSTPFFLSELRKRVFASAYGRDKIVASFLGRPPRLSRRYCRIELPLDLSDEELLLQGSELGDAVGRLTTTGWNPARELHRTTWLRMWFSHCLLREEILEFALGYGDEKGPVKAAEIRSKLARLPADSPAIMSTPLEDILQQDEMQAARDKSNDKTSSSTRYATIFAVCLHAGNAYTEFLLHRALMAHRQASAHQLIPVAKRLLGLVLLAQSKQLFFGDFQGDLVFLLAFHGLPAASVLAVELLKQEQRFAPSPPGDLLPRSQTIQDLSIFISSLEAVSPYEGNYWICHRGSKMLKKTLDQVLAPKNPPFFPVAEDFGGSGDRRMYEASLGDNVHWTIGSDAAFMDWLSAVEWDKVDWAGALSPKAINLPT